MVKRFRLCVTWLVLLVGVQINIARADPPTFEHPNFEKISGSPLYLNTESLFEKKDYTVWFRTWGIQDAECADCGTLFLMSYQFNDSIFTLGTARCDTLFKVLDTVTNGLKDIRCVNTHPSTGTEIVHFLRCCDSTGKYALFWPDGSSVPMDKQPLGRRKFSP